MVKVSIIMPSLDVADYIRECMDSVVNQTLEDIEIICVDAGSEDGTREILAAYAERDERIRIFDSPIRSYGYQVDMGLLAARGEYVGIVETDDFVAAEMYAFLYAQAKAWDADVSKADAYTVTGTGESRALSKRNLTADLLQGRESLFFENGHYMRVHVYDSNLWNGIYRRSFLQARHIRMNTSEGAAYQDIGFQQQVFTLARSFVYDQRPLYGYRVDREEASSHQLGRLRYVRQECEWLEDSTLPQEEEWALHRGSVLARLAYCYLVECRWLFQHGVTVEEAGGQEDAARLAERIGGWIETGWLTSSDMHMQDWKDLLLLLSSREAFRHVVRLADEIGRDAERHLLAVTQGGPVVICCCGVRGKAAAGILGTHGRSVLAFCDNDKALWGTKRAEIEVLSPEEVVKRHREAVFVIANKRHDEAWREQLLALGIPQAQIHLYRPA